MDEEQEERGVVYKFQTRIQRQEEQEREQREKE
jgi:hypothetical protein